MQAAVLTSQIGTDWRRTQSWETGLGGSNSLLTGKRTGSLPKNGLLPSILSWNQAVKTLAYMKIPYETKQGINSQKQGPVFRQQGSAPDFDVADLHLT
jgi:hypothetical protein